MAANSTKKSYFAPDICALVVFRSVHLFGMRGEQVYQNECVTFTYGLLKAECSAKTLALPRNCECLEQRPAYFCSLTTLK